MVLDVLQLPRAALLELCFFSILWAVLVHSSLGNLFVSFPILSCVHFAHLITRCSLFAVAYSLEVHSLDWKKPCSYLKYALNQHCLHSAGVSAWYCHCCSITSPEANELFSFSRLLITALKLSIRSLENKERVLSFKATNTAALPVLDGEGALLTRLWY